MKIIIFTFLIITMNFSFSEIIIEKEDKNFKKFLPYINQLNEIKNQSDFKDKILCKGEFFSFDVNNQTLNFLGEASLLANNIFISSEQIMIKFTDNKLKLSEINVPGVSNLAATCITMLGYKPPKEYTQSLIEIC